jgi:hypothetical protein
MRYGSILSEVKVPLVGLDVHVERLHAGDQSLEIVFTSTATNNLT